MRRSAIGLALVCLVCAAGLAGFANKAVHIDDTMFLWSARQIQKSPLDFYGFEVNWEGTAQPMPEVMKNPPGVSYYEAAVAAVAGFNEIALHLAFIPFAIACLVFTALLAGRFGGHPVVAAMLLALCPAFFVSATTLMADVMMLALWTGALWLWMWGAEEDRAWAIPLAGVGVAAAVLTKYPAINLIPLLLVYLLLERRHRAMQIFSLLMIAALLAEYEWLTRRLYGRGLLTDAFVFASEFRAGRWSLLWNLLVGISFTLLGLLGPALAMLSVPPRCSLRDRKSLLLMLWVGGVFVFLAVANWTANARTLLPMAPAAAILASRHWPPLTRPRRFGFVACIIVAATVTFITALADYKLAGAFRTAASIIRERSRDTAGRIWFTGHWGFQWYMEPFASPYDALRSRPMPGDLIVLMRKTSNPASLPEPAVELIDEIEVPALSFASTFSREVGAGFYGSSHGAMPYAFGRVPPERFEVYRVIAPIAPARMK